jgi:hypothetical protein
MGTVQSSEGGVQRKGKHSAASSRFDCYLRDTRVIPALKLPRCPLDTSEALLGKWPRCYDEARVGIIAKSVRATMRFPVISIVYEVLMI